jgi:hypothetical protein
MNEYFPDALISGHDHLIPEMQADPKDKHVLAAAVHGGCDVLVTDHVRDFNPPSTGPYAMRVERLSQFLNRKLQEEPVRVVSALQTMVNRNRLDPCTMPALIDKMATQPELRPFAQQLNERVLPDQRGSHEALTTNQQVSRIQTQVSAAFKGIAPADGAVIKAPSSNPEARRPDSAGRRQDREPER